MHYGFVHEGEKCCCNYVIDTFGKTLKYILICQIVSCYKCDFSAPTRKTFRRHNGFFHECVKCYTILKTRARRTTGAQVEQVQTILLSMASSILTYNIFYTPA